MDGLRIQFVVMGSERQTFFDGIDCPRWWSLIIDQQIEACRIFRHKYANEYGF